MVGEPVEQGASEAFGAEHLGPFGKRQRSRHRKLLGRPRLDNASKSLLGGSARGVGAPLPTLTAATIYASDSLPAAWWKDGFSRVTGRLRRSGKGKLPIIPFFRHFILADDFQVGLSRISAPTSL